MNDVFVVVTRWMLFARQIALRPALFQASQAFSTAEGFRRGGLGGEDERPGGL